MATIPSYVISLEKIKHTQNDISNIKESTNLKLKNSSMKALLKDYADYLIDEKSISSKESISKLETIIASAISTGNATQKMYKDINTYVIDKFKKKNYVLEYHKKITMEALNDVDVSEFPEAIQDAVKAVIDNVDVQNEQTEVIPNIHNENPEQERETEIDVVAEVPEDGTAIINVDIVDDKETSDAIEKELDPAIINNEVDPDASDDISNEVLKVMKYIGGHYGNLSLEAVKAKLDDEFVHRIECRYI